MPQGPIAGTAFLKVDGAQYPLKGNLTVSASPIERTAVCDPKEGMVGFYETPRAPFIEGDVSTLAGLSTEQIEGITNATVTAELINGYTYVLSRAFHKGLVEINTHDGQFHVRFEGKTCDLMT